MTRCRAITSRGTRCKRTAVVGRTLCKRHGGDNEIVSVNTATTYDVYSRFIPSQLQEAYERSLQNSEQLSLSQDIATIDALIQRTLDEMEEKILDGTFDVQARESQLLNLIEHRRRLVESEAKYRKDLRDTMTREQALTLLGYVVAIINENVKDADTRRQIAHDIDVLVSAGNGVAHFASGM